VRKVIPVLVSALFALALSACGGAGSAGSSAAVPTRAAESAIKPAESAGKPAASSPGSDWKIAVAGLGQEAVLTGADFQKIGTVTVKAAMKEKDTTGPVEEWTGVPLAAALKQLGATQYTTIKVESADGVSSREYTPDLVDSKGTILGTAVNGKPLDSDRGPVQMVVDGKGSNWWIKQVAKITVVK
jgi:DMSO/TMAO reductase YedYZ molybdopterin-dependent catalytic subunit